MARRLRYEGAVKHRQVHFEVADTGRSLRWDLERLGAPRSTRYSRRSDGGVAVSAEWSRVAHRGTREERRHMLLTTAAGVIAVTMKGRHKVHLLLGYVGILSTAIVVNACHDGRAQTPVPATTIRDALTQLVRGEADLAPLTVTFDHLHPLHGGLQLTIRGDGTVEQRALGTKAGEPKERVTQDDHKALVALLVKHEVWTQRVDERQPVPDESRATLKTCYRDQCVEIWEWSNDLEKNTRIGDVLKFMQTVAWHSAAPEKWAVTIKTNGGFTGKGTGGIIATSDGSVTTDRLGILACRQQLTSADLEPLRYAVAEADPAAWIPSYVRSSNPYGCCDQFQYALTLEVQRAEGTSTKYSTGWYSEMSNALPADVRGLFDAAWKIKKEADAKCKPR